MVFIDVQSESDIFFNFPQKLHMYKCKKKKFLAPSISFPSQVQEQMQSFIRYALDKHSFIGYKGQLIIIFQLELYAFLQDKLIRYRQLLAMKLTYITYNRPNHLFFSIIKVQPIKNSIMSDFSDFSSTCSNPNTS